MHRSIEYPGDVLIVNKTLSSIDGIDDVKEYVLEIIGFDQRILWAKVSEMCSFIDYGYFADDELLAEYEVVCSYDNKSNERRNYIIQVILQTGSISSWCTVPITDQGLRSGATATLNPNAKSSIPTSKESQTIYSKGKPSNLYSLYLHPQPVVTYLGFRFWMFGQYLLHL